ncbi:MAG: hypothetical protein P8P74_14750 [Crocinitomicaceae bacterium]|nr:hypothetical protein [Crocinitomicaceae bacterium]
MISPIKNSLFAVSTALVMGSSIHSSYAAELEPSQTITQEDQIGKDWTFVQLIDGISISYSTIAVGQERFLSVKFENTNSEATDFVWSMTKNNASIRITADEMIESRVQLTSFASEIVDGTYLIELNDEDQFSDFIVSIKATKH